MHPRVFLELVQIFILIEMGTVLSQLPSNRTSIRWEVAGSPISADSPKGKCIIEHGGDLKTGKIPKNDCNSCFCSNDGTRRCTKKGCKPNSPISADSPKGKCIIEHGGDLKTGKVPKKDCNRCSCMNDGTMRCTRRGCQPNSPISADSPKGKCIIEHGGDLKTGKIPKKDCNSCFCSDDGGLACTMRACPAIQVPA